ncbi:MAG TPA: hypothetical protein VFL99_14955 [Segeticoccus sp.]|uniref:hypothetical protein n=1 Tax=Segeticoccus sp. TaxID=2706531 RepID=UPI002D7E4490|nr:hypothetical protein [Segeticoccus sp.]HET8601625.1 hypothetical protein [Segeticoccus sp.]
MDTLGWAVVAIAVLVAIAWYLSYSAARLDRLHARVEGSLSALDAQLVRRAEATLELAGTGALDPASSLILASAATESLETGEADPTARSAVESNLTRALELALVPEVVRQVGQGDELGREALERVRAATQRVQLARRFHNEAVVDVRRIRRKKVVRWARLAGHAELPRTVEFDDELPVLGLGV